jgi:hypothetical protein
MNTKNKIMGLLKEGFKISTLKKLNEKQINVLYKKVVNEQTTIEKAKELKGITAGINNDIENIKQSIGEEDELTEDWGSSDQYYFNQSIHRDLGEPDTMPSPFSPEFQSAVESAVDFYWDDWEEYQTDYEGLVDHAKRMYLRSYFPEKFSALVRMFEPVKDDDIDGELGESQISNDLDNMAGIDRYEDPNPPGNEGGPSDNMKANDGMGIFEGKKKPAKMKTPITTLGMFEGKKKKGKYNPWAVCTDSLGLEGKKRDEYTKKQKEKFERCVRDVKKQNESFERKVGQIEESIVSLIKNYKKPTMTKKELLEQGTKEAPVKTPTKTPSKPERKSPYKPKHKPAPKAGDTKTAPTRVKPGTKEKPDKKNPYKPKHKPAPKAGGESDIPSFLKFDNLNITFRDE